MVVATLTLLTTVLTVKIFVALSVPGMLEQSAMPASRSRTSRSLKLLHNHKNHTRSNKQWKRRSSRSAIRRLQGAQGVLNITTIINLKRRIYSGTPEGHPEPEKSIFHLTITSMATHNHSLPPPPPLPPPPAAHALVIRRPTPYYYY